MKRMAQPRGTDPGQWSKVAVAKTALGGASALLGLVGLVLLSDVPITQGSIFVLAVVTPSLLLAALVRSYGGAIIVGSLVLGLVGLGITAVAITDHEFRGFYILLAALAASFCTVVGGVIDWIVRRKN